MGIHDFEMSTKGKFVSEHQKVFIAQQQYTKPQNYNITFIPASHTGITALEKDSLIRRRIIENAMNSISTLRSLSNLVTEIPNMVILDHISIQVRTSCTLIFIDVLTLSAD